MSTAKYFTTSNATASHAPDNTYDFVCTPTAEAVPVDNYDTTPTSSYDSTTDSTYSNINSPVNSPINNCSGAVPLGNSRYVHVGSRRPITLMYCPSCAKQHVPTRTRTKPTTTTWVCVVAGIFIFWPLCWLPLVIPPMKQTNHYCDGCGIKVGRVKPFN